MARQFWLVSTKDEDPIRMTHSRTRKLRQPKFLYNRISYRALNSCVLLGQLTSNVNRQSSFSDPPFLAINIAFLLIQ